MAPFKMPLEYLQALLGQTGLSADRICLSLAANHAGDQGAAGLDATRRILSSQRFGMVGAYDHDRPPFTILRVGRLTLGVVAWTQWMNDDPFTSDDPGVMREHHLWDHDWKAIARDHAIDCLIAMPHWGVEMCVTPAPSVRTLAEKLVRDWGFSVICGSHPHIIQPVEFIGRAFCHYSLSNFTFTLTHVCERKPENAWITCLSALTEVLIDEWTCDVIGYEVHPILEYGTPDGSEVIRLADYAGKNKGRYEKVLAAVFDAPEPAGIEIAEPQLKASAG